jgi:hypothetical protein
MRKATATSSGPTQVITALGRPPEQDRHRRMIQYSLAMAIRLVCLAACFLTPGWWVLLPAAGAMLLPLLAVLIANAVQPPQLGQVTRPGHLQRTW